MAIPILVHKVCVYSCAVECAIRIFLYSNGTVSLVANGILLLLLYHKTGAALGNYRILLVIFAIVDIGISILHVWYIPMFALFKNGFIYYGYGALFGKGILSRNSIILFSTTFYLPFFLIDIHFIYRYLSLARPSVVKEKFIYFMSFCTVYAIVYHVIFYFLSKGVVDLGISPRFLEYLAKYEHRPLVNDINVGAVEYIDEHSNINFNAVFIILAAGSVGGHSNVVSLICIYKIFDVFRNRALEVKARRVHIQLFRALLLQFSIPFLFSFLPFGIIVAMPVFNVSVDDIGDVCAMLISLFPALDPIFMILSISRFRLTLIRWIDVLTGNTARRNEKNAREISRVYYSMVSRRHTYTR